ncbi:hypothetical protein VTN02DRAFT_2974 [Thermoascus thermophilus]
MKYRNHCRKKPRRLSHPSGSRPPTGFWNNLSKVWLTTRALRELDRRHRHTQAASRQQRPSYQELHRRPVVTRRALAEWNLKKNNKDNRQPAQTAEEFLSHCCTTACLKDIKLFARHGGPDLSDLRGYQRPVSPLYYCTMSSSQSSQSRSRKKTAFSNSFKC